MKKNLLVLGILLIGNQLQAKEISLTVNETIELALKRNEQVQITNYQLEIANTILKKAYSGLFPTLKLEGKATKTKQDPALFGGGIISENYQQSATVTLNQPVYTFGRLSGAIDAAKAQGKLARHQKTATLADIELTVKKLFYNAMFYQKNYEISKESYENALNNQKALRKRVSFGRISQGENLKMKADIASRKPLMLEAQRLYESSISELKSFLNIEGEDKISLKGNLENIKNERIKESKIELSDLVQVNLLQNQFEVQKSLEDIESSNYLPTLSFFASYGENAIFADIQKDHYIDQTNIGFGLALTMNFDLGGAQSHDRQISRVETRVKKLQLELGKRQIKFALKNLYDQKQRLIEKRDSLKEAVSLAHSSYKVALNSFANGTVTQTQLNDRELLFTNNKIAYAQNLLQINIVNFEIENLETTK